jgi:cytochrome c
MNKPITIVLAVTLISIAPAVFAASDAARGQELYQSRCTGCHSVDQSRIGPAHQGVFSRRAGRVTGYDYSAALKASKVIWSDKTLEAWLRNPERAIPGQKMGYQVTDATDRTDLIAYLRSLTPP